MGLGSSSSPKPPNYTAAAQATAQGNLEAARAAAAANRVSQYTPYGNLVYSHTGNDPDNGWSATQTLSPEQQQMLNYNNSLSLGMLSGAQSAMPYIQNSLANGGQLDQSQLAQMPISGQQVQDAVMARLQPQLDRNYDSLRTRLANQGLNAGSAGYQNAMDDFSKQQNDLYNQAALQGINTDLQARQQGIQEQYQAQAQPINLINAMRNGNQVQNPQFTQVPQQATTAGPDYTSAAMAKGQYNVNQAAGNQAQMNSLLGAGGTLAAAYMMSPYALF